MQSPEKKTILKEISPDIASYILHEIPPYIGLVLLHLDSESNVIQCFGPVEKYLDQRPDPGTSIDTATGLFVGMLPPLISPMVIPHVKVNDWCYVEIHFLMDTNHQQWILMLDQTKQVELIHPILQLYNEEKLNLQIDKKISSAKGALSALSLLDYMSYERKNNLYRLLGSPPAWFWQLDKHPPLSEKIPDPLEVFPYLEIFQMEADLLWSGNSNGNMTSDIWEEKNTSGERFYLRALALQYENRSYLLIKPLEKEESPDDNFIQKAREQKLTLDRLAATEKKLKQLLSFKDQFVSIISHDLRSPIGAVIGISEILLADESLTRNISPSQLELLVDIRNEMQRLLDYNDKLFQWSNLELGNFRISRKDVAATALSSFVEKMQNTNLHKKNIRLIVEAEKDFSVKGDETLLGQALNNLIGNSVKFTPEGGTIRLVFSNLNGHKMIEVIDTGIGMDKNTCDQLFTDFTRKTTFGTYGEKGTGLGLGIVKKIIDAHGFQISVSSQPGNGSRFTIKIPDGS